jgi:hypothetical protein
MENLFRSDLIAWLAADPLLDAEINVVSEENPLETSAPRMSIATSASTDWSTKSGPGREVRIALELVERSDQSASLSNHLALTESRIATLNPEQNGYRVVVTQFLRSRAERRQRGLRAVLLEYRFRLLDTSTE